MHDQAVRNRGEPRVVTELGEADARPTGERVVAADGGEHRLLEQIVSSRAGMLAARRCRILEADRDVQAPVADTCDELVRAALQDAHHEILNRLVQARDRRGHQRGEHAGERADPQAAASAGDRLAELRFGEAQPLPERIGVLE